MDDLYFNSLQEKIIEILKTGPIDLKSIVSSIDGAFPVDVIHAMQSLVIDYPQISDYLKQNSVDSNSSLSNSQVDWIEKSIARLSVAHPADYDWRFTAQTVESLTRWVGEDKKTSNVALFGVSTLLMALNHFYPNIQCYLFNKSAALINDLKRLGYSNLIKHDLFKPFGRKYQFDLIIADPPWYNNFYKAFIRQAALSLNEQGILGLSMIPALTRPDAEKDVELINSFCVDCGFELIEVRHKFLCYETPEFERKSLDENSVAIKNWRFGDLFIYEKADNRIISDLSIVDDDPKWTEYIIQGKKIKIDLAKNNYESFNYKFVDEHKYLPSVSRRYMYRSNINFWTSDNIAFNVSKLGAVNQLLEEMQGGISFANAIENVTSSFKLTIDEMMRLKNMMAEAEIVNNV